MRLSGFRSFGLPLRKNAQPPFVVKDMSPKEKSRRVFPFGIFLGTDLRAGVSVVPLALHVQGRVGNVDVDAPVKLWTIDLDRIRVGHFYRHGIIVRNDPGFSHHFLAGQLKDDDALGLDDVFHEENLVFRRNALFSHAGNDRGGE